MSVETREPETTHARNGHDLRRWGWILITAAVWTFWVWITRIVNIAKLPQTTAFKAVHYTLAAGSMAFGAASAWIGVRLIRRTR